VTATDAMVVSSRRVFRHGHTRLSDGDRSPWQNGQAERLICSIRWECLDHVVVLGEAHLRRILAAYSGYYNELRPHLSLEKDSPGHRLVQQLGQLRARPILGGLYHEYCQM
jgi:transposase InsO family protein